jgi:hypothetical protein
MDVEVRDMRRVVGGILVEYLGSRVECDSMNL